MKLWRIKVWPSDSYGVMEIDIVAETEPEAVKAAKREYRERISLTSRTEARDVTLVETVSSGATRTHRGTREWVKRLFG